MMKGKVFKGKLEDKSYKLTLGKCTILYKKYRPFIKCQKMNFKDWVYNQQIMNWMPLTETVCFTGLM